MYIGLVLIIGVYLMVSYHYQYTLGLLSPVCAGGKKGEYNVMILSKSD